MLGREIDFPAGRFGCWGISIICDLLIPCSFSGFLSLAPIPAKAGMFVEFQDLLHLPDYTSWKTCNKIVILKSDF